MSSQTALGVYLSYIDEALKSLGENSEVIFADANLAYPNYVQPGERVPLELLDCVTRSVRRNSQTPHFFLLLGCEIPVMAHSNLGAAIMASADVDTALTLVERYAAIAMPAVRFTFHRDGNDTAVEFQLATPHKDLNMSLVESLISTTSHNFSLLTGERFFPRKVQVTHDKPSYASRYREFTRCDVEFSAATNQFIFSKSALNFPIVTANKVNEELMVQQCETELKDINAQTKITDRIREIASLYLEQSPSIGFVAQKLSMSERTLRRRLTEEGVNFRGLLKQIRQNMAEHYLEKTDMRIEHIAWQLGYKETANFRKAFKEQTGCSPRAWRQAINLKNK